jgi:hypothetical protein
VALVWGVAIARGSSVTSFPIDGAVLPAPTCPVYRVRVYTGHLADVSLRALSDTYVPIWEEQEPPHGYGGGHHDEAMLTVSRNDTEPRQYISLLQFERASLAVGAGAAYLELFVAASYTDDGRTLAVAVHMATSPWNEETVDSRSAPEYGGSIAIAKPNDNVGDWARWDVTDAVRQWSSGVPQYGFVVATEENPGSRWGVYNFGSLESSTPPRLRIETTAGTALLPLAQQSRRTSTPTQAGRGGLCSGSTLETAPAWVRRVGDSGIPSRQVRRQGPPWDLCLHSGEWAMSR